jgi:hypothetical protein
LLVRMFAACNCQNVRKPFTAGSDLQIFLRSGTPRKNGVFGAVYFGPRIITEVEEDQYTCRLTPQVSGTDQCPCTRWASPARVRAASRMARALRCSSRANRPLPGTIASLRPLQAQCTGRGSGVCPGHRLPSSYFATGQACIGCLFCGIVGKPSYRSLWPRSHRALLRLLR